MENSVLQKVLSLLDDHKKLELNDSLVMSGRLSSLKVVELAVWLEKNYQIDFSDETFDVFDFDSVGSIINLIKRKQEKESPG
jgi:acyl carrier protein